MSFAPYVDLFRYNAWANDQLFGACADLDDEALDFVGNGVSGSIRELLMHIAGGQQTLVLRTDGRQHEGELGRWSAWPGMAEVQRLARETSGQLLAIAERVTGDEVAVLPYAGKSYRYPQHFFLLHALVHGVEHRTEVKVALMQLDIATPDLDGWPYATAVGYGAIEPDSAST